MICDRKIIVSFFSLFIVFFASSETLSGSEICIQGHFDSLEYRFHNCFLSLETVDVKHNPDKVEILFKELQLLEPFNISLSNGRAFVFFLGENWIIKGNAWLSRHKLNFKLILKDRFLHFIFRFGSSSIKGLLDLNSRIIRGKIFLPLGGVVDFVFKPEKKLLYLSFDKLDCQDVSFYLSGKVRCTGKLKGGLICLYKNGHYYLSGGIVSDSSWIDLGLLETWMHLSAKKPYLLLPSRKTEIVFKGKWPILELKFYLISSLGKFYSQSVVRLDLYAILKNRNNI